MIAGRQFLLVPLSAYAKKILSPLGLRKQILVPLSERTPPYINNETIQMPVPYDDRIGSLQHSILTSYPLYYVHPFVVTMGIHPYMV